MRGVNLVVHRPAQDVVGEHARPRDPVPGKAVTLGAPDRLNDQLLVRFVATRGALEDEGVSTLRLVSPVLVQMRPLGVTDHGFLLARGDNELITKV
jgi:hypothetical protein